MCYPVVWRTDRGKSRELHQEGGMDMELAARLARRANVVDEAEKARQVEAERGNKSFTQNKSFTRK